jgi:hypothetical protein
VRVDDAVDAPRALSGRSLEAGFGQSISAITFGLISMRDRTLWLGPFELLRFGLPEISDHLVAWPIDGGALAAEPGGRFAIRADGGRLVATVAGYKPRLPRPVYAATQLIAHHAVIRLQLLWMRGRRPAAGVPADPARRLAASAIDLGACIGLAMVLGRKHRLATFVGVAAGYHLACWSTSGRTLGGAVMHQRVAAVDGSRPSFAQAVLRLAALPIAAVRFRAVHDDIAATDVFGDF